MMLLLLLHPFVWLGHFGPFSRTNEYGWIKPHSFKPQRLRIYA
jgi:hypothetical protein